MIDLQRPRLEEFRRWIIQQIPCEPRHVRADLGALALPALLIKYMNWRDRFVPTRARNVTTWDGFLRDPRGLASWPSIIALAQRITSGEDMTPYLSKNIVRYGYVRPKTGKDGKRRGIEWGDKDYALNGYGRTRQSLVFWCPLWKQRPRQIYAPLPIRGGAKWSRTFYCQFAVAIHTRRTRSPPSGRFHPYFFAI